MEGLEKKPMNKKNLNEFQKEREGITEDMSDELRLYYNKLISKPAYYFTLEYARMNKNSFILGDSERLQHRAMWGGVLEQEASRDVNEDLRLVEIDKDILPMIQSTKNELFYRPLFFPSVFVNCNIEFENLIIKGFLIIDHQQMKDVSGKIEFNDDDWTIFCVAIDTEEHSEFYGNFRLLGGNYYKKEFHEYEHERKRCHRMNDYVRQLAVNIVDMVEGNDGDLDIVNIEMTRKQNLKRIKRGKLQLPTKIYIKPRSHFRKVLIGFREQGEKLGYGHKFMVRGFWRHYRAERYKEKIGTKKWIKPFWKGQGNVVSKDYKVKGDSNERR